jgi:hypothetical protein
LVVWEGFLALLLEHKAPEIDVGNVDRWVGGLGRHGGRMGRWTVGETNKIVNVTSLVNE